MSEPRSFFIRTYGCQMNVHDSEKVSNLLHHAGRTPSGDPERADLLLINTCSIRDKAENQLYSDLGQLRAWKAKRPGRVIGVGGCVAQQVGDHLLQRFPHLDFVFGTHNVRLVPSMVAAAEAGERRAATDETRSQDRFDLPAPHADQARGQGRRAFVTVMEGCDMFCSFCIVPRTRGREISRPAQAIVEEAHRLADAGIREITLLGQTVNAYGRHDVARGRAAEVGTMPFAELLAHLDAIAGIDRIRYTSPHPIFFDAALMRAHGELESLCPHVHLPLQSGSDAVLEAMRRRYGREEYLGIVEGLRAARPDIDISTDLIVGFPGETEADFEQTLDLMRRSDFVDSYSFKYSPRPDTRAAEMSAQVEAGESQRRLVALQALQRELTTAHHRARIGSAARVRIEGESRKGGQLCGRDAHHRLVNIAWPEQPGAPARPAPGELVPVAVVEATPHSLIAVRQDEAAGFSQGPGALGEKPDPAAGFAVKLQQRSADESGRGASADSSAARSEADALRVIG